MKKFILIGLCCVLGVAAGAANLQTYSITLAGAANSAVIPAASGVPIALSFNSSVQTAATVSIIRPDRASQAVQALVGGTNVYVNCLPSNGFIGGALPTTSDYLVFPKVGSSNATYAAIGSISAVLTNGDTQAYLILGTAGAVVHNVATNGPVFIGIGGNVQSIGVPASAIVGNAGAFSGFRDMPVVIATPATAGAGIISGVIERE